MKFVKWERTLASPEGNVAVHDANHVKKFIKNLIVVHRWFVS